MAATLTPRQLAALDGAMTYNTGKPCRNGHTDDRYTLGGMCKGCIRDSANKIRDARRDQTQQRVEGAQPVPALIKPQYKELLFQFTKILRYADETTIAELQAYITMLERSIK